VALSLAAVGIDAKVTVPADFYGSCTDPPPSAGVGMCIGDGWFPDFPSVGNLIVTNFGGPAEDALSGITNMGATRSELAKLGSRVRSVPTVAPEIAACNQELGSRGIACWTGLDQYLITNVMPAVPLAFARNIRITGPSVASYSWDLANQSPALDRLGIAGA
jgi:hypothetical protein